MNIKHVVWDWNGTIINDLGIGYEILSVQLQRKGLPTITMEEYREVFEHPVVNVYLKLGFTEEEFLAWSDVFHDFYDKRWRECDLHHDAEAALLWFGSKKTQQFLLSAHEHSRLLEAVDHFAIGDHFVDISGAKDKEGRGKIAEAQRLLTEHSLKGEETLFIGDSCHDYEVSVACGSRCALVSRGIDSERKLRSTGAPVFASLGEVLEHFGDSVA